MLEIASHILLWALTLLNLVLILTLVRHVSRLPFGRGSRLTGEKVPSFDQENLAGQRVGPASLHGRAAALLFLTPDCEPCVDFVSGLAEDAALLQEDVAVLAFIEADTARASAFAEQFGLPPTIVYPTSHETFDRFAVEGTPHLVVVDRRGVVKVEGHPAREGGPWKSLLDSHAASARKRLTPAMSGRAVSERT